LNNATIGERFDIAAGSMTGVVQLPPGGAGITAIPVCSLGLAVGTTADGVVILETEEELAAQATTPDPGPPPVSAWKVRKALTAAGLRDQIEAAVAAASQDITDAWEYAGSFECDHPLILSMVEQMGLTDEQVDQVFTLAATL
jgi:hypothetical protein